MARGGLNLGLFHKRYKVTAGEAWEEIFLCSALDIMTCEPNLWLWLQSAYEPIRSTFDLQLTNQRPMLMSFSASSRARGSSMQLPAPPMSFLLWQSWARGRGGSGDLFLILQHLWIPDDESPGDFVITTCGMAGSREILNSFPWYDWHLKNTNTTKCKVFKNNFY